jgi:uncharacterized protein YjbI with pentapeptide repeats
VAVEALAEPDMHECQTNTAAALYGEKALEAGKALPDDAREVCTWYRVDRVANVYGPTLWAPVRREWCPTYALFDAPGSLLRRRIVLRDAELAAPPGDASGARVNAADLRGRDLRFADLQDSDLRGADVRGADLTGANLQGARLDFVRAGEESGARLGVGCAPSADGEAMCRTSFAQANLVNASLDHAELRGSSLTHANLAYARLRRADLGSATADRACLFDTRLDGAVLDGASLEQASLAKATASAASLAFAHWPKGEAPNGGTDLTGSVLTDASFDGARAIGAVLENAEVTGASFDAADLRRARLGRLHVDTERDAANFRRADLREAELPSPDALDTARGLLISGDTLYDDPAFAKALGLPPPPSAGAYEDALTDSLREIGSCGDRPGEARIAGIAERIFDDVHQLPVPPRPYWTSVATFIEGRCAGALEALPEHLGRTLRELAAPPRL